MEVKLIITLPVIIIVAFIAVTGYIILSKTASKKWGYTKEKEKKLENASIDGIFKKHRRY